MLMSARKTPIALFVYNRPLYTETVLGSLSKCDRFNECDFFIFSDGAKTPEQAENVDEVRRMVKNFATQFEYVRVIEREKNFGLARNIVDGVSQLCEEYGRVIVVEDDHYLARGFIDYMLKALDQYENDEHVAQISGFMHPVKQAETPDAFFLPLMTSWGWATWQRAWTLFKWEPLEARELLKKSKIRHAFDINDSYPYTGMLLDRLDGKNQSWGILFWWAIFRSNKLVLHPRRSLVWVGGFDGSGVHCGFNPIQQTVKNEIEVFSFGDFLTFPKQVKIDKAAYRRVSQYLKYIYQPGIKERAIRKIRYLRDKVLKKQ
jgi:hypothetical protein